MFSLLSFSLYSLLITSILARPSEVSEPALVAIRETDINAATDLTVYIYASSNCDQKASNGIVPPGQALPAVNYDAQVPSIPGAFPFSSFTVNRALQPGEVLDFSIEGWNSTQSNPIECSLYFQTVVAPLSQGECQPLKGPVTCFRLWHQ